MTTQHPFILFGINSSTFTIQPTLTLKPVKSYCIESLAKNVHENTLLYSSKCDEYEIIYLTPKANQAKRNIRPLLAKQPIRVQTEVWLGRKTIL